MKVLLIDDHALFREGLALLMGHAFEGVQCLQAGTVAEALALGHRHPDVALVLLDLGLPDAQGLSGLLAVQEHLPGARLVVLSADDSARTVLDAIEAGAQGFIPKSAQPGLMQGALQRVLGGAIYLPGTLVGGAAAPMQSGAALGLSQRQLDVLCLLVAGRSNKRIGRELDLAESTVKTHLAAVFRRLEVNSRTQAVVAAARLGLRLDLAPHRAATGEPAAAPASPAD